MKTLYIYFFLILFTGFANAQTLTGVIKTTDDEFLENTNVMAKPTNGKTGMKFAIADHLGRYKLELDKETNYTITVNYIGFEGITFEYNYQNAPTTYDFVLTPKNEVLNEIIIDYDYQPIVVKKDTLVYDVAAFMNGTERKLKDQLQKLPGVEVTDSGKVKVQGKTVTQFMVEGNSFFGGGSKLGVENIPADAVDKVEVIDHFTEVAHMKEVSGSDDLAMNIKLKEDKKQFIFGDLRIGYGNNKFYETHASLFYYTPKVNWSIIGNLNNFGSQLLTYDEIFKFEGLRSVYIKNNQQQLINLYQYANPNSDVVENKNQFLASDFRYSFSKNWNVKGLFLFNKNWIRAQTDQNIQYLQANDVTIEYRTSVSNNRNELISGKLSADFRQNKNTTYNYNLQIAATANNRNGSIISETNLQEKNLKTTSNVDNLAFSHLLEFHKTFNKYHKGTIAFTQSVKKETPNYNWFSNQKFLENNIPWNNSDTYFLNELQNISQNNIQINDKHYWIAAKKHHFYTTMGYNGTFTHLNTQNYFSTNNTWNSLDNLKFGNDLSYKLNNPFTGLEYKFLYKKLNATFGVFLQHYQLKNTYPEKQYTFAKNTIEPEIKVEYEFNKSENVVFNYTLNNSFLDAENYTNRWQVNSFNALFKGNALLQNLQYQNTSVRYSNFNMYSGINIYATLNYNKRNKNIRNQVELFGIDQFYTTVMSNSPETKLDFSGYLSKRIKKIEFRINTSINTNKYTQVTNNLEVPSKINYQNFGAGFKTLFKQAPNIYLNYTKSFSQMYSSIDSKSNSNWLSASIESKFLKHFLVKADYSWYKTSFQNQNNVVEQANAYFELHKDNSPWTYMIKGNNLLNTGLKNEVNFTDFTTTNTNIFILPRAVLFSIQYKL